MKSILLLVSALICLVLARADEECDSKYTTVVVSLFPPTQIRYRSTSTTLEVIMESTKVAWLGFGYAADGTSTMVGNKAVIGVLSPGTLWNDNPKKYLLGGQDPSRVTPLLAEEQTLMNATFAANETQPSGASGGSSLSFTTNLIDGDQVIPAEGKARFIYAVGDNRYSLQGGHILRGSILLDLAPCVDFTEVQEKRVRDWKTAQKIHGLAAAIALGLLIPLAVSSAVFRERLNFEIRGVKGWVYIHIILNVLAYLLLTAAFVIAVLARKAVNGKHFFKTHDKLGLAIFIFVSLQAISSFFRPRPPKNEADETLDESPRQDAAVDGFNDEKGNKIPGPKSLARASWEIVHRITALAILGMVIYQLYSGLEAYKYIWNEIDAWYTVYYIWFALIVFFVLFALFKIYKRS